MSKYPDDVPMFEWYTQDDPKGTYYKGTGFIDFLSQPYMRLTDADGHFADVPATECSNIKALTPAAKQFMKSAVEAWENNGKLKKRSNLLAKKNLK